MKVYLPIISRNLPNRQFAVDFTLRNEDEKTARTFISNLGKHGAFCLAPIGFRLTINRSIILVFSDVELTQKVSHRHFTGLNDIKHFTVAHFDHCFSISITLISLSSVGGWGDMKMN